MRPGQGPVNAMAGFQEIVRASFSKPPRSRPFVHSGPPASYHMGLLERAPKSPAVVLSISSSAPLVDSHAIVLSGRSPRKKKICFDHRENRGRAGRDSWAGRPTNAASAPPCHG